MSRLKRICGDNDLFRKNFDGEIKVKFKQNQIIPILAISCFPFADGREGCCWLLPGNCSQVSLPHSLSPSLPFPLSF